MTSYAPLWCKSYGSFLEGASSPEELVETAAALKLGGLALTDRDGLYSIVPAHTKAQELKFPLVVGSQLSIGQEKLVVLAESHEGYRNICRIITHARMYAPKGEIHLDLSAVCQRNQGLIALYHSGLNLDLLREAFPDRLYVMNPRHRLPHEASPKHQDLPRVAVHEVLYHHRQRRPLQDVLTCIRHKVTLATAGRLIQANAEHDLHTPEYFSELFHDCPDEVARTLEVVQRCQFSMAQLRYVYPAEHLAPGTTVQGRLEELTWAGAHRRYPDGITADINSLLHKELKIIAQLDYGGYFLTLHDLVEFCKRENILCQGRGSAANSVVCFCLGVTAVDPTKVDLLFERFLSLERAEPPDIDLDIAHQDRERVIQYLYKVYGRHKAAMVANLIRYRPRSAMRDVGKALGLEALTVERFTNVASSYQTTPVERLQEVGLDPDLAIHRRWMDLTNEILGFPRHLGIHPGGFLLGHEPVSDLVPIENARMADRTVIQWDKRDIEALGLFKVDLLALGALSLIQRCFDLLKVPRDMYKITREDDPKTWDMLARAETIGTFQVESRAQMTMLARLRPRTFYDLVIQISIVRPGPISGGMVHPYLRRRNGEEEISYPHPCLEPILRKTLGVPLFQEQVIKLAMVAADYTGGEADQLRRDMGAWKSSSKLDGHRERIITAMMKKDIPQEFAERVFEQIRGFGEYGFPESHAASFALIAYVTCWMKCNHPAEFVCSLLNSQPMGFYSPLTIIQDAKRSKVRFLPIDIAISEWDCTMEEGAVRMGLRYVKGLEELAGRRIVARRRTSYLSMEEMARRADLQRKDLSCLARAGALNSLGKSRRAQLWAAAAMTTAARDCPWLDAEPSPDLPELSPTQSIFWDCKFSAHSLQGHPLSTFRTQLKALGLPTAEQVRETRHGAKISYAGLVICRQHPDTAKGFTFFTMEDETGLVNVVVKPQLFMEQNIIARSAGLLGVKGKLECHDNVIHLIAETFFQPDVGQDLPHLPSRDFH